MAKIEIQGSGKTDESIIIYAFSTSIADKWYYSLNDGGWVEYSSKQDSAETIIIGGLTPNTKYKVEVRAKRKGLLIYDFSSEIFVTTLDSLSVYSPSNVYFDDENASITFNANIPTEIDEKVIIQFNRANTEMFSFSFDIVNGQNTLYFNEQMRHHALVFLQNSKDLVFYFFIKYSKNGVKYETEHRTFHGKTTAENSAPILTDFVYRDNDPEALAVTANDQLLITNESNLVVNITPAEPRNKASISAYTVTVGNVSVSTVDTRVSVGRVDLSGIVPIVVTAIDSRGYTATMTKIVNYIPYTPIELAELSIERINNVEKMTKLSLSGSITPIMIDGVDKNPLKAILYQTRPTNEQSFGELIEIPQSNIEWNGNSFTADISQWVEFDSDKSFYIQVIVQDQLTQDQEMVTLPNGKPLLALRKGMLGINNNNPQHALDVDGDLNLTGKILINGEEVDLGGITE